MTYTNVSKTKASLPRFTAALGIAGLFCMIACSPVVKNPAPPVELNEAKLHVQNAPYRIGAGDEIEVKFFFAPELSDVMQVRPDGKISLMFAQDIIAAGKTPEELAEVIKAAVSAHVNQPDLVVVLRNFASQKVYVGGEVSKPGSLPITGPETLMQVLSEAGWITPAGRLEEVVIMRKSPDGKDAIYPIDVKKIMSGEDLTQNIVILAGDQIFVPPSDSTTFDRWVDQNIRQALPFGSSVVFTNQWGN